MICKKKVNQLTFCNLLMLVLLYFFFVGGRGGRGRSSIKLLLGLLGPSDVAIILKPIIFRFQIIIVLLGFYFPRGHSLKLVTTCWSNLGGCSYPLALHDCSLQGLAVRHKIVNLVKIINILFTAKRATKIFRAAHVETCRQYPSIIKVKIHKVRIKKWVKYRNKQQKY